MAAAVGTVLSDVSPPQVQEGNGEDSSTMQLRSPFNYNERQEESSSANQVVSTTQQRRFSTMLRPVDYTADNDKEHEDESPQTRSIVFKSISLISRTMDGLKKALNCPDHGFKYDDACANCQVHTIYLS